MIVLDTDAVSNLMSRRPAPALVARLASVDAAELCTTAITIGELAYGAHRAGRPDLYERAMRLLAGGVVLPFDQRAAELYGRIRNDLEREGQRLDDPDLRIASIVLGRGATLITGNRRHFDRVAGLSVEAWA